MSKLSSKSYLIPMALLTITITSAIISSLPSTSADNISPVDDTITITVDSACTMGQTVLSSSNTLNPGETATIGSSRIAAYCNDGEGYAIYAIGYTNGEYGNTNLISTDNPNHIIPTGTSSTLGSNSYWNMQLTPGTSTASLSFIPDIESPFLSNTDIPDNYTKVASYPSTTIPQQQDPTASGSYFTTTYQSHISTVQPAGAYSGEVQYVMVHPSTAPKPEIPSVNNMIYMQDFAKLNSSQKKWIKDSMLVGAQYILKDKRDNKSYYISRLADGNIWMTQNLDLEIDANKTYTSADTDLPADTNWSPTNSTIEFSGVVNAELYDWGRTDSPYSADPGDKIYYTSNSEDADSIYDNLASCEQSHITDCQHYHAGNYYNFNAAVASNSVYDLPENSNVSTSICPAGWRLPLYNDTNEYIPLLQKQGGVLGEYLPWGSGYYWAEEGFNFIRTNPLFLVRAGYVTYPYAQASYQRLYMVAMSGAYWLGTIRYNYTNYHIAESFNFRKEYATYGTNLMSNGASIRCIAR